MEKSENSSDGRDEQRLPRRRWWLKKVAVGFVLLIVGLLVLRAWALRRAEARLQAEIDKLRARGELVLPEDFRGADVAEQENAAVILGSAGELTEWEDEQGKRWDDISSSLPLAAGDVAMIEKTMAQNAKALAEVRRVRGKGAVYRDLELAVKGLERVLRRVNVSRGLFSLLELSALRAHQLGDDDAAVEYVRDMLTVARVVDSQPLLVPHLVAIGIRCGATESVILPIAPRLRIEGLGNAPADGKAASAEQVRLLVADLLDDRAGRERFVRAMQGERAYLLDVMGEWGAVPGMSGIGAWVMRPVSVNETRLLMERSTRVVEAARESDWAAAKAKLPGPAGGPFGAILAPSQTQAFLVHYRGVSMPRAAAMELAKRMYEVKYGRLPQRAEDLVPEFLSEVPKDPVTGGGAAMPFAGATQPSTRPGR